MAFSRFSRLEEERQTKRLLLAIAGSITIIVLLAVFGLKLLIGFSLFVEKLKGSSPPTPAPQNTLIIPPILNPLPTATYSASMQLTGTGKKGLIAIVYVNGTEAKTLTIPATGTFSIPSLPLVDGQNMISAKLSDDKGNTSDLSNILTVTIKKKPPMLTVDSPGDNSTVNGDTNTISISGKTEDDVTVSVNDHMIVTKSDDTFTYTYPLNEGDNTLKIVAKDVAGNQTTITRTVKYKK